MVGISRPHCQFSSKIAAGCKTQDSLDAIANSRNLKQYLLEQVSMYDLIVMPHAVFDLGIVALAARDS